jgi:hypothetical protein
MDENLKQEAASLMKDTSKREEFAEMFIEYVNPTHIATDFIGMLMSTRNLKPGDSLVKKVRKGLKVYTLVPGSIPLAGEITVTERINYILDGAIISATVNEWELASGELGTLESFRSEMQLKLRDFYINKVFTALSTIWSATNTPDNYTAIGGNVTKTALDNMVEHINQTTPGAKAIVGTRKALYPIQSFAGWAVNGGTTTMMPGVQEEIFRTGWLGNYLGVPLVVVNQQYDNPEDYNALVPDDKILVVGENIGEFITFGPANYSQFTDPKPVPPQFWMRLYQQFGLMVDNAQGIGVLKVA